jgi:hypothetical protein
MLPSLNLYGGKLLATHRLSDSAPSITNTLAHDEPKTHRQHDILALLYRESGLEPVVPSADTHIQVPARSRDSVHTNDAMTHRQRCLEVGMMPRTARQTLGHRAVWKNAKACTCMLNLLPLLQPPKRRGRSRMSKTIIVPHAQPRCRLRSRQHAMLPGWRWLLLDSAYQHFAIQQGCQTCTVGRPPPPCLSLPIPCVSYPFESGVDTCTVQCPLLQGICVPTCPRPLSLISYFISFCWSFWCRPILVLGCCICAMIDEQAYVIHTSRLRSPV